MTDADWMSIGPYDSPILETTMSTELKTVIKFLTKKMEVARKRAASHEVEVARNTRRAQAGKGFGPLYDRERPSRLLKEAEVEANLYSTAISLLESTGKDTEMLDWLETHLWVELSSVGRHSIDASSLSDSFGGNSFREAITAAMQKEEVEK